MAGVVLPNGKNYFATSTGAPAVGYKVYTYVPNTSTPKDTYTTSAANVANTNPVILDSRGEAAIYWVGDYDVTLKDSTDATIWGPERLNQPETAGIRADLIDSSDAAKGDALVAVKRTASGADATTLHAWIEARDEFNVVAEFSAVADGSDQTAKVQDALTALGSTGGTVRVPRGCKFDIQDLTFPKRSNLEYWRDDDTSANRPPGGVGTSERIMFAANSSGTGGGQGIVNEQHFEGAFHPGFIVNVRKDVTGHDSWLGPGQSRTNPVRASYLIQDEQTTGYWIRYEHYPTYDSFSGVTQFSTRRVYTLTGVGTGVGGWVATLPAAPATITGVTSGAKGQLISLSATQTVLLWVSGVFVVGEQLTNGSQTPANTLSVVSYAETVMPPFGQDFTNGYWSIGLPVGSTNDQFAVGGRIASSRTRSMSTYLKETVNDPGFTWVDSYENSPPNGFHAIYDTSVAAASRRIYKRKYGETTNRQVIGSLSCSGTITHPTTVNSKAHNIASVANPATGRYVITFTTALASAEYQVLVSSSDTTLADVAQKVTAKGTTTVEVRNYNSGGSLANLTGSIDVAVFLGDT